MTTASEDWLPDRSPEIEHLRPPLQLLVTQVKHLHIFSARRKGIEAVEKKLCISRRPGARFGKQDALLAILSRFLSGASAADIGATLYSAVLWDHGWLVAERCVTV